MLRQQTSHIGILANILGIVGAISSIIFTIGSLYLLAEIIFHPELIGEFVGKIVVAFIAVVK